MTPTNTKRGTGGRIAQLLHSIRKRIHRDRRNRGGRRSAASRLCDHKPPPVPASKFPANAAAGNPQKYIKKLDGYKSTNHIFKTTNSHSRFEITDLPADPEALLAGIFQYCIDEAILESRKENFKPDHLGCTISAEGLDMGDIYLPIRPITDNTTDAILNFFLKVAQSKAQQNVNLYGQPFVVKVTTCSKEQLPRVSSIPGGFRRLAPVRHQIPAQSLIRIENTNDSYCLFYALQATLMRTTSNWPRHKFYNYLHGRYGQRGALEQDSRQLMCSINARWGLRNYEATIYGPMVIDHWNNIVFQGQRRIRLFIFGTFGHYKPMFTYGPTDYDTAICLLYEEDAKHFHGVRNVGSIFGRPYCLACQKPYNKPKEHRNGCVARCNNCSRVGPSFPCQPPEVQQQLYSRTCNGCNKTFRRPDCYDHHLRANFCANSKKCLKCGVIYNVRKNKQGGRGGHVCYEYFCRPCGAYHDPKRGCFIQPLNLNAAKEAVPYRLVAFDAETMFHKPAPSATTTRQQMIHEANFITAIVTCPKCIESGQWQQQNGVGTGGCDVCGPNRTITFSHRDFFGTQVDEKRITSNPLNEFAKWILTELPPEYESHIYSHNGGRFDMVMLFREIFEAGINPEMIKKGNKMYSMKVARRPNLNEKIHFKDSYNLFNCPLGALPGMYDLQGVSDKPFFPYLANRPDNYGRPIFPSKADYLAEGMMKPKRKEFERFFEQQRGIPFYLEEELASYCLGDTQILMAALVAFRKQFMERSAMPANENGLNTDRPAFPDPHDGLDPLRHSITIASSCMKMFKLNHLHHNQIALVPENGYDRCENQSLVALKFLKWYGEKRNVSIQMAHSIGGEKKFGKYPVDGYIEAEDRILEVHGCVWHSCPRCYPDPYQMMPRKKTAGKMRELDDIRTAFLRTQARHVDIFWECQIHEMLKNDLDMQQKFDDYEDDGPINIRDCFYGGRTGALKLHHRVQPGQKISYFDVQSLYPYCSLMAENWMRGFPTDHPKRYILNKEVDWRYAYHNPYPLAIIKCFVIPPRHCDVPVLPMKFFDEADADGRLLFPLCAKCARDHPDGGVQEDYECPHTDQQRGWISTCTSIELEAALEEGYRVTKLYRVLEYNRADKELFRSYMRQLLAEKIHASGFDPSIKDDEQKQELFINYCWQNFGIDIQKAKMKLNKPLRQVIKLMVNNLWGRFSLRNHGLSQVHITRDPAELPEFLDARDKDVNSIDELNPQTIIIGYEMKKEWITEHNSSNVVISLFTTSYARLLLLKAMQKVVRSPNCVLLYTDTDSLIYSHPVGQNPIELSLHVGGFSDEFPQHRILEATFGGSKQYALLLQRLDNGEQEHILKIRGLTLSSDVIDNQGLRYDTFKEMVLKFGTTGKVDPIKIIYPHFLRPSIAKSQIISEKMCKIYRPYVCKGIVRPSDLTVLPFGFVSH